MVLSMAFLLGSMIWHCKTLAELNQRNRKYRVVFCLHSRFAVLGLHSEPFSILQWVWELRTREGDCSCWYRMLMRSLRNTNQIAEHNCQWRSRRRFLLSATAAGYEICHIQSQRAWSIVVHAKTSGARAHTLIESDSPQKIAITAQVISLGKWMI